MSRILITGGAGLLGSTLARTAPREREVHVTERRAPAPAGVAHGLDLADAAAVRELVARLRPELVIHTAYSTADGERDIVQASTNVGAACAEAGAALLHLSTDALFDGEHAPYAEDATPAPVHAYGRHKAEAEARLRALLPDAAIVRTSLLTCFEPPDPRSAVIVDGLRRGDAVRLFVDELRMPIHPADLAAQLWELAALPRARRAGAWHLAGPEALSRYALGLLIAARFELAAVGLTPALSRSFAEPRPRDVRLLTGRAERELRSRARGVSVLAMGA